MPRKYVRKKQTVYSEGELEEHLAMYNDLFETPYALSVREACDLDDGRKIPIGTFWNRLSSLHEKRIGSGRMTFYRKMKRNIWSLICNV